ncbi:AzlD domain-containing protein [Loigolactobacillus jiayinensis]|uniref:AzlD domain-containing protein n=1 Tax=Loigolactobacillus jiayinensis TaxID=2486016 RepID=A0ABW1RET2_9LACO|nr:AzlD domain-containing protein [Loigolactobacillus jiayinensis]
MSNLDYFILIITAAMVAFIPRVIPLLYFSKRKIPVWFNEWMKYIPVALFTALIAKDVFVTSNYTYNAKNLIEIISTILVFLVAAKTKSMLVTVVVGLVAIMGLALIF